MSPRADHCAYEPITTLMSKTNSKAQPQYCSANGQTTPKLHHSKPPITSLHPTSPHSRLLQSALTDSDLKHSVEPAPPPRGFTVPTSKNR